jgi:hypothetical protein
MQPLRLAARQQLMESGMSSPVTDIGDVHGDDGMKERERQ